MKTAVVVLVLLVVVLGVLVLAQKVPVVAAQAQKPVNLGEVQAIGPQVGQLTARMNRTEKRTAVLEADVRNLESRLLRLEGKP